MNCTECTDKLSDFLLDELPEQEAVLVQEHLALCPSCMATYKQLKGTGRAMEAIPAMRSVQPSQNFDEHVMSAARVESQKIIETLPPEKRLRMEARAATRKAQLQVKAPAAVSQRRQTPWSGAVVGILILGLVAATCIMLYPADGLDKAPKELGTLTLAAGKAEQFFQKQGEQWSAVNVGKPVRTDDEYATRDDGRIRFEMEGGSVCVGPGTEVKFRRPGATDQAFILHVPNGEMGVERAEEKNGEAGQVWVVRTDAATVRVPAGSEVYVRAARNAQGRQCDVLVRKGSAAVSYWGGKSNADVKAGEEASFWEDARIEPQKSAPENLLPLWRMDLLNDAEMSALFGGAVRVVDRRSEGPVVELSYGFGRPGGLQDWNVAGGAAIAQKPSGTLSLPAEARCTLAAPITVPASIELAIHPDSPKDGAIACVVLDTDKGRVSADFDRQVAVLTVREPDHPGASRVPFRAQAKTLERVRLDFVEAGLDTQAVLTTASGKSKPVTVSRNLLVPGALWVSALREEALLEGIRVTGQVPRKWLRQKLAGTP
ncbi:MAG: zf-HC2 domain-containing protein [Planctomycetota bacterium]|nr:zf-HC2 domain-containing protein [Planctomycetota bacterium]